MLKKQGDKVRKGDVLGKFYSHEHVQGTEAHLNVLRESWVISEQKSIHPTSRIIELL